MTSPREAESEIDRRLVDEIARGSADALGALYDRHAGLVYALARRILKRVEDAEEVVQDVFTQVWKEAPRYQPGRATVAGWLVMLARTRAIDRLRSRTARPDVTDPVTPDAATPLRSRQPDPEQLTMTGQSASSVRQAVENLPAPQRSLIELAYYEGLTQTDIAARTGVPLGTVKTRIRSAMASLMAAMTP